MNERRAEFPGRTTTAKISGEWYTQNDRENPVIMTEVDLHPSSKTILVIPSGLWYPKSNQLVQFVREQFRSIFSIATFDYTGLKSLGGASSGTLEDHSLGQMMCDVRSVVRFINNSFRKQVKDIVLVGLSSGGNAIGAYLMSEEIPDNITKAIFVSTPADFMDFRPFYERRVNWDSSGKGVYTSSSTGKKKVLSKKTWEISNNPEINPLNPNSFAIKNWYVIGSNTDELISAQQLLSHQQLVILEGANHNFTNHRKDLANHLQEFLKQ